MVRIIAAIGANGELGKNNSMMWNLPGDMKFFRQTTLGSDVIMGRKTYESIGRPLPKRNNIVISRNPELKIDGVTVVGSLEAALNAAKDDVYIIGGASIYKQALDAADELILTEIDNTYPEADVYFPEFDKSSYDSELILQNSDDGVSYKHIKYIKRK